MVIFPRTYDLLSWLLPRSERFPAAQRFVVTKRLQDAALDFQEALFLANAYAGRQRLAHQQEWLTAGQYEHVSKMVAEVGRLLGGWIKQTRSG